MTKRPIVPAKISIPRLTETYDRRHVFRALDAARKKPVLWISAPAGAGKTSVVTTYLAACRLPALWYNVDARDGDAANLFHYLTLAAKVAAPRRKVALPVFTAGNQHGAFARGFFEALYEQRPSPSAIVLDDYHDARSELFDEVVRELIAAVADAGRQVFDTTLHRLRWQLGDIDVIRMNDRSVYLDERACWLDTWAFDDLAAEAERQIACLAPHPVLVDLGRQLLRIYRGPVLAHGGADKDPTRPAASTRACRR